MPALQLPPHWLEQGWPFTQDWCRPLTPTTGASVRLVQLTGISDRCARSGARLPAHAQGCCRGRGWRHEGGVWAGLAASSAGASCAAEVHEVPASADPACAHSQKLGQDSSDRDQSPTGASWPTLHGASGRPRSRSRPRSITAPASYEHPWAPRRTRVPASARTTRGAGRPRGAPGTQHV